MAIVLLQARFPVCRASRRGDETENPRKEEERLFSGTLPGIPGRKGAPPSFPNWAPSGLHLTDFHLAAKGYGKAGDAAGAWPEESLLTRSRLISKPPPPPPPSKRVPLPAPQAGSDGRCSATLRGRPIPARPRLLARLYLRNCSGRPAAAPRSSKHVSSRCRGDGAAARSAMLLGRLYGASVPQTGPPGNARSAEEGSAGERKVRVVLLYIDGWLPARANRHSSRTLCNGEKAPGVFLLHCSPFSPSLCLLPAFSPLYLPNSPARWVVHPMERLSESLHEVGMHRQRPVLWGRWHRRSAFNLWKKKKKPCFATDTNPLHPLNCSPTSR